MISLSEGQSIQREIRIPGVDQPVYIEIGHDGISFWSKKRARKRVFLPWSRAVNAGLTPTDVPSWLMDKPMELLRYQASGK